VAALLTAILGETAGAEPLTFNDPTPTLGNHFGNPVAIDGNFILIGDRDDNSLGGNVGQAHLFDANSGNLLRTFNSLAAPTTTDQWDRFGSSVALDGNNVLITAQKNTRGEVYLFDAVTGNPPPPP
jgi:hypothetical protein